MSAQPQEEFCPRCGQWVTILDEYSGWCEPCAKRTRRIFTPTAEERHCGGCGETQPLTEFSSSSYHCRSCQTEAKRAWRKNNSAREQAYHAARRKGRCPECYTVSWLTKGGVMVQHLYRLRRVFGGERCAGSGQPPKEAK